MNHFLKQLNPALQIGFFRIAFIDSLNKYIDILS